MMKLVSKKEIPTEICYDLSVEKNHNFFANGICVHNTNASIVREDGETWFQSRNNIITPQQDNAGFASWANEIDWTLFFDMIPATNIVIFGEWCGGNIQSGVAITGLPKMFVIFKILADDQWLNMSEYAHLQSPEMNIFNIENFQTWEMEIDFNVPALAQNKLIDITSAVEQECPVGKAFGKYFELLKDIPFYVKNDNIICDKILPSVVANYIYKLYKSHKISSDVIYFINTKK